MLYVKLAVDREMAKAKDFRENHHKDVRTVQATNRALKRGHSGGLSKEQRAVQAPLSQPPGMTDSEWFGLSAEDQLAWAKNIQDPRIAVGSHSPLEKRIKSLGGIHSSGVKKLLAQEFQQENEALAKLKATSFDFRFAKAEEYYYQRYQEMMMKEAWDYKMVPKWEIMKTEEEEEKRSQSEKSEDANTWDYLVSERELNHIEKHIYRAERARGLRDQKYQLLPQKLPSEMLFPKILTLEDEKNEDIQKTHKTKTGKHKVAWAKNQMKEHKDRMIRGRELSEQRNDQREPWKLSSQTSPLLKPQVEKEERMFERVTAYPIFQPYQKSCIEVSILREKSKENKIQKPLRREFLSLPPFLRSQLKKNKV
uniref:putative uncharacterized protein ZNRD1-AS1 n=1 Tax=Ictidomys tridecemlineatus TaxID=43179 RepID=UPI00038BE8AF|nr:putative uncharacterized protein ZNRD1-AS1 [Ictidomys tridecemlineatus]